MAELHLEPWCFHAGKGTQCEKIKELFVKQPLCSSIPVALTLHATLGSGQRIN